MTWILVTYCDSGHRDALCLQSISISFDERLIKEKISQIVAQTNTVKEQHRMVEQSREHMPEFLQEIVAHAQGHNAHVLAEWDKHIKRYNTAEAIVDGCLVRGIELTDDFERVKSYTKGTM